MAVNYLAIYPFVLSIFTVLGASSERIGQTVKNPNMDVGNWSVGDCIIAQFAMEFVIHTKSGKDSDNITLTLPPSALAEQDEGKHCDNGTGKFQSLFLSWREQQKNDTSISLQRSLTIRFARKPNETFYGVNRLWGKFDLAVYNETVVNKTTMKNRTDWHKSTLEFDSKLNEKLMFHTPIDQSYLCTDVGKVSVSASVTYNITDFPDQAVDNTTIHATSVRFDAFRNLAENVPSGWRTAVDCDYHPNDIVPIAVGVALAALVVAVLVAYMVGRRRNRQRGYQSV